MDRAERKMVKRYLRPPVTITVEPEELARRYLDGASLDDLGVLCGCTAARIRRILVAHGVEIRPAGTQSRQWPVDQVRAPLKHERKQGALRRGARTHRLISRHHNSRCAWSSSQSPGYGGVICPAAWRAAQLGRTSIRLTHRPNSGTRPTRQETAFQRHSGAAGPPPAWSCCGGSPGT